MRIQIGSCALELHQGDIAAQVVDAIVNAANSQLAGGGGVDGAIHRRGGPAIMADTDARYPQGCPTGSAVISTAGDLSAKYVIHAVGPVWRGGTTGEAELLAGAIAARSNWPASTNAQASRCRRSAPAFTAIQSIWPAASRCRRCAISCSSLTSQEKSAWFYSRLAFWERLPRRWKRSWALNVRAGGMVGWLAAGRPVLHVVATAQSTGSPGRWRPISQTKINPMTQPIEQSGAGPQGGIESTRGDEAAPRPVRKRIRRLAAR